MPKTEPSVLRFNELKASNTKKFEEHELLNKSEGSPADPDKPGARPIPKTLSELFAHFLADYNPKSRETIGDSPVSWLDTVLNTAQSEDNTTLNLAITALSLVRLGRKHQSQELQTEGLAVYGQALEKIHDMLSSAEFLFQEQTLASCITLSIFEASTDPSFQVQYRNVNSRCLKPLAPMSMGGLAMSSGFLDCFNFVVQSFILQKQVIGCS